MKDYLYDGTFDGYLSAIFYAYPEKEEVGIYKESAYSPSLLATSILIQSESDKTDRVYQSILSKLSYNTLDNLYKVYLSEVPDAETLGLHYLKLCYRYSDDINLAKNNDIIRGVDTICKRVRLEVHRFYGFTRFKEISPMVFYAAIEPDHNILPLMMGHFKKRFSDQHFIIHDLKRKTAIFYNTHEILLSSLTTDDSNSLAKAKINDAFEDLFKTYYQSTTIKERYNLKLRNKYIPKRYYKHLVELS